MIIPGIRYKGGGGVDPYFSDVSLLLHMDGASGATVFPDSSSNAFTVTPTGSAQVDTSNKEFGTGSLLTTGSPDNLYVEHNAKLDLSGVDCTVEFWIWFTGSLTGDGAHGIVSKRQPTGDDGWSIYVGNGTTPTINWYASGHGTFSAGSITADTWHFVALTIASGTLRIYVDGVLAGTNAFGMNSNTYRTYIASSRENGVEYFPGNLDDVRITKGVARYVGSTCPVPSAPFPNS
jgi:hypothetical protein